MSTSELRNRLEAGQDRVLIGIDAGTSLIKSVAFDLHGNQLALCSRPNEYKRLPNGGVEQDMRLTWKKTAETLQELGTLIPALSNRVLAVAVTGQGDGTWLVDKSGQPLHDAWLWLDARSTVQAKEIESAANYAQVFNQTGTGVNVCQMRTQLRWIAQHTPELLNSAATSYHCKDYLYHQLTGVRATDPSEGIFTFGDFRQRDYSPEVIAALELSCHAHLLPPIVDGGVTAHALTNAAANETGLPAGLPISLGYVDVICTALGGGLLDDTVSPGMTILGTTGMHMRYCPDAASVSLNSDRTGYTMAFPDGGYAQMQSNMAATLNIDWALNLALEVLRSQGIEKTQTDLLLNMDQQVLSARVGAALYHPYISSAGERGPFINPDARASLVGLEQNTGYFELVRSVYEGLAFAAKDCYTSMGELPGEIRVSGGAAKSTAMLQILASVLERPVRIVDKAEAGAAGAVMMSAVQQGLYASYSECARAWVSPHIGPLILPDSTLASVYSGLFSTYQQTRKNLEPSWSSLSGIRAGVDATVS